METTNQPPVISGQWCLVTVRPRKRESFLKYLNNDISTKQLQAVILEIVEPQDLVYEDMILLRISNYSEARSHLQKIDHFLNIQRLKSNEVSRMLNQ